MSILLMYEIEDTRQKVETLFSLKPVALQYKPEPGSERNPMQRGDLLRHVLWCLEEAEDKFNRHEELEAQRLYGVARGLLLAHGLFVEPSVTILTRDPAPSDHPHGTVVPLRPKHRSGQ